MTIPGRRATMINMVLVTFQETERKFDPDGRQTENNLI